MRWPVAVGLFGALALAAPLTWALSPVDAANYCYDQVTKMRIASRDLEDRSWEDCMEQFRRPVPSNTGPELRPSVPSALSPEQRPLPLQWLSRLLRPGTTLRVSFALLLIVVFAALVGFRAWRHRESVFDAIEFDGPALWKRGPKIVLGLIALAVLILIVINNQ
jgi:hypothetical protein